MPQVSMRKSLFLLTVVIATMPLSTLAFDVPPNDGFYTESIDVLSDEQEASIELMLGNYVKETSNTIAILMTDSMSGASIVEAAVETGRKWKVGTAEHNNGILIFTALRDRETTIQVGYGLEGAVPDIVAGGIIQEDIGPNFAQSRYYEGLLAAIDALKKHIGGEYTAARYNEGPSGFGQFGFILLLVGGNFLAALLGRSKSWWLGGVIGAGVGVLLASLYGWWLSIPLFIVIGLVFDYIVSRMPPGGGRHGGPWGGFGGGRGGGGGYSGFGGGSFGGGGASGRW